MLIVVKTDWSVVGGNTKVRGWGAHNRRDKMLLPTLESECGKKTTTKFKLFLSFKEFLHLAS